MEWRDEGIILHAQALGERKHVINIFTRDHGRCAGVLRESLKTKAGLQCGGKVKARWGARLETHVGYWTLEPLSTNTAFLLDEPGPLAALASVMSLCHLALPERHAYPYLYERFEAFLNDLSTPHWIRSYIFFELQNTLFREVLYRGDIASQGLKA